MFIRGSGTWEKNPPEYHKESDIKKMLNSAENDDHKLGRRNYIILKTLFQTGLRRSELANLKKKDVVKEKMREENKEIITYKVRVIDGKGGKDRDVPINSELYNLLITYSSGSHQANCIFSFGPKQVNRIVKKYANRVGIESNAHRWRHSYAVHFLQENGNIKELQENLGHSSLTTTQIYLQITDVQRHKNYQKMNWNL